MNRLPDDPRQLLTIDVLAEIRKLTTRRFKTPADATVGFVGFLCSLGFKRIDVTARRRRIAFDCGPHPSSLEWLHLLSVTLDPDRPHVDRHESLVRLETDFGLDALAPFSVLGATLKIHYLSPESHRFETFTLSQSGKPRRGRGRGSRSKSGALGIVLRGKLGVASKHKETLEHQGRFSPVELRLEGRRISKGHRLEGMLLSKRLRRENLEGVIGLPRTPGLCELHILKNGMIAQTKMYGVQRGLEFHAAVEPKGLPSSLVWGTLRQEAEALLFDLKDRRDEFDELDRGRIVDLLIERSPFARKEGLLDGAPVFQQLHGPALCLEDIKDRSRREKIYVVASEDGHRGAFPRSRTVLLLSPSVRNILEKHHGVVLHEAPRRRPPIGIKVSTRMRWFWTRLLGRPPVRSAPEVSREELEELADAVRGALQTGIIQPFDFEGPSPSVVLSFDKRGPLAVDTEKKSVVIGAQDPVVKTCARAYRDDPELLPAALAALFGGRVAFREGGLEQLVERP